MLNRMVVLFCIALAAGGIWTNIARAEFPDVPIDHWAYDAVSYLEDEGFVIGYPDGTFGGDRTLTRYEFAMVVSRIYDQFLERLNSAGEEPAVDTQAVVDMLMDEFQPEIDELRGLIEANTARIDILETSMTDVNTKLTELNDRIDQMDEPVSTHGDITLRFEGVYPSEGLQDQRPRFMMHYGFVAPINPEITFGGQLASGTADSRQSTFQTLGTGFGIKPVFIDRAYVQWKPAAAPEFTAWGGKFQPPWTTTDMVWDKDVMVEGLAERWVHEDFNMTLAELVPAVEGYYLLAQLGFNNLGWENNTVALTYHYINDRAWTHIVDDMESGKLTNRMALDRLDDPTSYQAFEAYWEWKASLGDTPIKFQANYLRNLDSTASPVGEEETVGSGWQQALMARLTVLAAPTEPGQCNFWGEYGKFQPNSVLSWLTDAWRGSGDTEFWAIGWNYKLMQNTDFSISYINADRISNDSGFTDVLVNLTTRFD
jgi:hypothetical protein